MSLQDYSDGTIAGAIIFGGLGFALLMVLGMCSFLVWFRRYGGERMVGRRRSNNSIVREQSQSVLRGDHPITFVLPTVSLSEAGSETDPTQSDLESLGWSSRPSSPALSLASLTGANIYSTSLLSPLSSFHSTSLLSPHSSRHSSPLHSVGSRPSPRSPPITIPSYRASPRPSPSDQTMATPPSTSSGLETGSLGKLGLRLTYRKSLEELQIKVLRAESLPTNYKTGTANVSVKVSLLPTKLPKYSTAIVSETLNPEFNEEFTYLLERSELAGKVIRFTLLDHEKGHKKAIGYVVVSLADAGLVDGEGELVVREVWRGVRESVEEELTHLLADRLQLSLRYDPEPGRLSLGILQARIQSVAPGERDTDIYTKVTLFEGRRVIKAKKTRLLACSDILQFQEKFSILLPPPYLEEVSCVVSLCSKNRFGGKQVLGRTSVGPFAFASGQGLDHWIEMGRGVDQEVVKWYTMT